MTTFVNSSDFIKLSANDAKIAKIVSASQNSEKKPVSLVKLPWE